MVLHGKHWPEQLVTVAIRARMSPVPSGTHQSKRKFCIGMVKSVSNSYVWCCLQNEQALFCFETCKSAHMLSTGMQNKMDASRPTWTFLSLKSTGNFFLGSSVFLASPFFLAGALPPPPRISCSSKILLCCVPVSLVIILKDLRPYCSSFLGIKAAEDTNRGNRNTSVKTFIMVVDAVWWSAAAASLQGVVTKYLVTSAISRPNFSMRTLRTWFARSQISKTMILDLLLFSNQRPSFDAG